MSVHKQFGRFDLFDLMVRGEEITVVGTMAVSNQKMILKGLIQSIGREDGSGHNFMVEFDCTDGDKAKLYVNTRPELAYTVVVEINGNLV